VCAAAAPARYCECEQSERRLKVPPSTGPGGSWRANKKSTVTKAQLIKAAKLRGEGATWNTIRTATGTKLSSSAWFRAWEREGIEHVPAGERVKPKPEPKATKPKPAAKKAKTTTKKPAPVPVPVAPTPDAAK
jgi:hypothetical protein